MGTPLGYDRTAPGMAISVTVNEDLVRQAKRLTRNLSGTIEDLLASFVDRETARQAFEAQRIERITTGLNRIREQYGSIADDFPSF